MQLLRCLMFLAPLPLMAACTVSLEESGGVAIERWTPVRGADLRPAEDMKGWLHLEGPEGVLLLPLHTISAVRLRSGKETLIETVPQVRYARPWRMEIVIPASVLQPEQVRAIMVQAQ